MKGLPTIVSECLIGLGHLVRIFLLLDCGARIVSSVHELAGEALIHGLLTTKTCIIDDPADTERHTAVRTNLDRNLVVCTTNAACAYFEDRHYVLESSLKNFQRI